MHATKPSMNSMISSASLRGVIMANPVNHHRFRVNSLYNLPSYSLHRFHSVEFSHQNQNWHINISDFSADVFPCSIHWPRFSRNICSRPTIAYCESKICRGSQTLHTTDSALFGVSYAWICCCRIFSVGTINGIGGAGARRMMPPRPIGCLLATSCATFPPIEWPIRT